MGRRKKSVQLPEVRLERRDQVINGTIVFGGVEGTVQIELSARWGPGSGCAGKRNNQPTMAHLIGAVVCVVNTVPNCSQARQGFVAGYAHNWRG